MFRQKIMERDDFKWDERKDIAMKSGDRCAHCGRKVYFGYGATVDHFIPISKGGTNRDVNRVMLCEKCNKEKDDKVLNPDTYIRYLDAGSLESLRGYFRSYAQSFEYVERGNLLACDEYEVKVEARRLVSRASGGGGRRGRGKGVPYNSYALKRAREGDEARLTDFFVRYLRKRDFLKSEKDAASDVRFWMSFGCVYFTERAGEVKLMAALTVTDVSSKKEMREAGYTRALSMYLFPMYANETGVTLAHGIARGIPRHIMDEQGLGRLPVVYHVVSSDGALPFVIDVDAGYAESMRGNPALVADYGVVCRDERIGTRAEGEELEKIEAFFARFRDVGAEVDEFLEGRPEDEAAYYRREIVA